MVLYRSGPTYNIEVDRKRTVRTLLPCSSIISEGQTGGVIPAVMGHDTAGGAVYSEPG